MDPGGARIQGTGAHPAGQAEITPFAIDGSRCRPYAGPRPNEFTVRVPRAGFVVGPRPRSKYVGPAKETGMSDLRPTRTPWFFIPIAALCVLFTLLAGVSAAQQATSIIGTVTDESGSVMPGVTV